MSYWLKKAQERIKNKAKEDGFYCGTIKSDHPMPIPEINKIYISYEDGKHLADREYKVIVKDVLRYKQLPKKVKKLWKQQVKEYYWLYSPDSGYFVKALSLVGENDSIQYFVRTHGDGWFSLNTNNHGAHGELDVDGSIHEKVCKYVKFYNLIYKP